MLESLKNKKILFVVAHPDDEIIGAGATMHKLINDFGCQIRVVILGEGLTSRSDKRNIDNWKNDMLIHKSNIEKAKKVIGYDTLRTYDFPDNRFDSIDLIDLVKVVEKEKKDFGADTIFTHHGGDLNIDHQKTFEAVVTAIRPLPDELVCNLITFETMSGTEWQVTSEPKKFSPNFFVELKKNEIEAKCKAMECYEFEKRYFPHPRSREALINRSQMWGIANGVYYAEAFQLIRIINKL